MDAEEVFCRELESAYCSGDKCADAGSTVRSSLLSSDSSHEVSSWRIREEKEVDVAIIGESKSIIICFQDDIILFITSCSV